MNLIQHGWARIAVSVLAIVVGAIAFGKPYWSLESLPVVLPLAALVLVVWRGAAFERAVTAVVAIIIAATLVIDRGVAIELFVYGTLAVLALAGIRRLIAVRQRDWFAAARGLALILVAVLGAFWLDVVALLLGLLIGPAFILAGAVLQWHVWRTSHVDTAVGHRAGWLQIVGRVASVAVLLGAVALSVVTAKVIAETPEVDESFVTWTEPLGNEPGVLLKADAFDVGVPDGAVATRILYTTTGLTGEITLATAVVYLPENAASEPLPVILWAHGTTGIAPHCAPSLLSDPLFNGAMLFPDRVIGNGWAMVAPDYIGMGTDSAHPYLVGVPTAQSSLDAVRAAKQLDSAELSEQTVVWGHSQGGGTALWIGIEAPTYAPDVPLSGVVAMAPASDLLGFANTMMSSVAGPIFGGYIFRGYADMYDDIAVNDYIRPGARFSQEQTRQRCLTDKSMIASLLDAIQPESFIQGEIEGTPLSDRLGENVPLGEMGVPLFLGQGGADPLVLPEVQTGYVQKLCDAGQIVEFHIYPGLDHMGVVGTDSAMPAEVEAWTIARFNGEPSAASCTANGQ